MVVSKPDRTTRRLRRSSDAAKALLVEAARDELLASGGSFELARVSQRAGVSSGLPHHYFGSRSGLLTAVVQDYTERLEAAVSNIAVKDETSWADRERRRVECYVEFIVDDALSPYVLGSLAATPEALAVASNSLERIIAEGTRNFRQGQEMGEVRSDLPPAVLSAAVHGAIRQVTLQALKGDGSIDRSHLVLVIWILVENWLTTSGVSRS
ncbi:hypothetical protein MNBD_ACTINO02-1448 [hydrothermal vent metagenome]|uniref:HTH tetR-type domain-containing protein n=1 Tax=hydrothermal vent metagenome TaxID=652676 RepID=A0A3B0TQP9_9ZZZZ